MSTLRSKKVKKVSVQHIHCILCDAWFIINKKLHKGNLQTQADVVHHLHTQVKSLCKTAG